MMTSYSWFIHFSLSSKTYVQTTRDKICCGPVMLLAKYDCKITDFLVKNRNKTTLWNLRQHWDTADKRFFGGGRRTRQHRRRAASRITSWVVTPDRWTGLWSGAGRRYCLTKTTTTIMMACWLILAALLLSRGPHETFPRETKLCSGVLQNMTISQDISSWCHHAQSCCKATGFQPDLPAPSPSYCNKETTVVEKQDGGIIFGTRINIWWDNTTCIGLHSIYFSHLAPSSCSWLQTTRLLLLQTWMVRPLFRCRMHVMQCVFLRENLTSFRHDLQGARAQYGRWHAKMWRIQTTIHWNGVSRRISKKLSMNKKRTTIHKSGLAPVVNPWTFHTYPAHGSHANK